MPDVRCLTPLNKSEEQLNRYNLASELLFESRETGFDSFIIYCLELEDLTFHVEIERNSTATIYIYASDSLDEDFTLLKEGQTSYIYKMQTPYKYVFLKVKHNARTVRAWSSAKFKNHLYPPTYAIV